MQLNIRNGSVVSETSVPRLSELFDHFFNEEFLTPTPATCAVTVLPMSLWEDEHNVYLEFDVPGVSEKDVEMSLHEGDLTLRGERKCERVAGRCDNRRYGRFEQRVTIPAAVDADRVEAKLANGVLRVTLPKSSEAKPRKIAIHPQ